MKQFQATYTYPNSEEGETTYISKPFNTYKEAYRDLMDEMERLKEGGLDIDEHVSMYIKPTKVAEIDTEGYEKIFEQYHSRKLEEAEESLLLTKTKEVLATLENMHSLDKQRVLKLALTTLGYE